MLNPDFMSQRVSVTARPLEAIARAHHLNVEAMAGKTVLDLGCGGSNLQAGLDDLGIDANVISVDMNPALCQYKSLYGYSGNLVQADLSELPVADASVDLTIASFSMPMWAERGEHVTNFYAEAARTVKPGGMLSVVPSRVSLFTHDGDFYDERLAALESAEREILESGDWEPVMGAVKAFTVIKYA